MDIKPKPWPDLYRVTLRGLRGEEKVETVLTFFDELKAVSMAVEAHTEGFIGPRNTWLVYAVEVELIGPAEQDSRGLVSIGKPVTLHDRMEF